ncbi:MAG: 5-formyltetrahydrofolate cyclo-ligase, partial [Euryarchaeota archaeon]|nr:5-formyltetrahydrofolate cyclo-ligase [Euryarchaeota archaeon]
SGSDKAAERVRELEEWKKAKVIVANPDFAQKKVREFVLKDGKILIMASPRLKHGYLQIDFEKVKGKENFASTIEGAFKYGVKLRELLKPDLIVTGCVAVDKSGYRLGKSGGFGDREISTVQQKFGKIPVITTVHDVQIVDKVPIEKHDTKVNLIVTPTMIIKVQSKIF